MVTPFFFGLMLGILWPVWRRTYRGIRHAVAEQRLIVFHDAPLLTKARIAVSDFIFGFCNPNVHIWEEESRARRLRREADYKGPGEVQKPEQLPKPVPQAKKIPCVSADFQFSYFNAEWSRSCKLIEYLNHGDARVLENVQFQLGPYSFVMGQHLTDEMIETLKRRYNLV